MYTHCICVYTLYTHYTHIIYTHTYQGKKGFVQGQLCRAYCDDHHSAGVAAQTVLEEVGQLGVTVYIHVEVYTVSWYIYECSDTYIVGIYTHV